MTSRTLIVLAAALVVLALVATWGQRSDAPQTEADALFLPGLEAALADVDRVRTVGAGGKTLATLERTPDNWIVAEKHGYPADIAKIRNALRSLADARIVEQKTANPDYYARIGVESVESEDASGIELIAYAGDDVRASVVVGDEDSGNLQYVRASDAETSYLVDRAIDVPRAATDWIDPVILDVSSSRIASVTIEHPDGEVVRLTKDNADETNFTVDDVPDGRELSYPGVANVIANTLRDLRLDDVAAADAELPDETTRTTFRTFDGLVVTATSFEGDDGQWIRFEASAPDAPETAADGADDGTDDDGSGSAEADTAEADAAAAAEADAATAAETDASTATAQSAAASSDAPSDDAAESTADAKGSADASDGVDAQAEAERINARVRGWQYQIPSYAFGQLTRRMEDLLSTPEDTDTE